MNTPDNTPSQGQPLRDPFVQRVEAYTKEEPVKAASAAFGLGILLAMLPIGGIVAGVCRLLFLLARPLLMILGVVKVFEHWDSRQPRGDEEHSEAADPENDQG
jgi:uncharacterized membrane protein YedE/YeeE